MLLRPLLHKIPFSIPLNTTQLHQNQNGSVARCCFALVYAATHQPQEESRTTVLAAAKVQHSGPYKKQQSTKRTKAMEIGKKMRTELLQKPGGEEKPEDGEKKKTKRRKPTNPKKSLQTITKPELEERHGKPRNELARQKQDELERQKELEQFLGIERFLNTHVFGQLEKERGIEEIVPTLDPEDPEAIRAQKEFEHLLLMPDMVKRTGKKLNLTDMVTGDESNSMPANQFRKIVYKDELANSDLTKPPSRQNPHPFDPTTAPMPPSHSRSLAPYANFVPAISMLVQLGMDLFEATAEDPRLNRALIKLDCEKEIKPKVFWLCKTMGMPADLLGDYLTRNPYFLLQDMDKLKSHQNYLHYRRFNREQSLKIISEHRYWLNTSMEIVDSRLGWIQRQFRLKPDELRLVVVKEPKIIAFGTGPIGGIVRSLNNECGFSQLQLKLMLIRDPRLFLGELPQILTSYRYLAYSMRVGNEQIVEFPPALRCPIAGLRRRHEFLFRLRKANYTPNTPNHIPLEQLLQPSDRHFAEQVARTPVADFNRFIKSI